jgi:tetratricopeptide (TPR) repeat protein
MDTSLICYSPIKKTLLSLPGFFWYFLSLPIWSPVLWRIPSHIHRSHWNHLLRSAQFLHRVGFQTESTWFWHALAYANLNQWTNALYYFERVLKSLDPIDTEAYRWCWHAYVLAKLGRLTEAQDLLRHANISSWPDQRQLWANEFLKSTSGGIDGTFVERPN